MSLAIALATSSLATPTPTRVASVQIDNQVLGVSSHYIGTCEGNVNFNRNDLIDLGVNTYRIYGGMSRWEPEDDDGIYGLPTIAQIKANPGIIPWQRWDNLMAHPPMDSDYAFSGTPTDLWQGSAQTIFSTLKQALIRPVVTIRNSDPGWQPNWALQLNPPRTEGDWNEWWEHVFATVYWLNVRHDYQVDDWEIHNEPDNRQQGWGGNQQDYFKLVEVAQDAIAHVYSTYLPGRTFHLHAPITVGGSHWPADALASIPKAFDTMNFHTYAADVAADVRQVRSWIQAADREPMPLWLGEWGNYTGGYDDLEFSLNLIKNLIHMSQPGDTYVDGSHLFSLYDWGRKGDFKGLIDAEGDRRLSYYALRLGIRALQGGHPVLHSLVSNPNLTVIATQVDPDHLAVLMVNDLPQTIPADLDFSAFATAGQVKLWEFSRRTTDRSKAFACRTSPEPTCSRVGPIGDRNANQELICVHAPRQTGKTTTMSISILLVPLISRLNC
jgi:hypothetical protein